jgi:hypothetical protein
MFVNQPPDASEVLAQGILRIPHCILKFRTIRLCDRLRTEIAALKNFQYFAGTPPALYVQKCTLSRDQVRGRVFSRPATFF